MGGMSIGPQPIDFGSALTEMRLGNKVTREAWRDNGVFVVLQQGYPNGIEINGNTAAATGIPQGTRCRFKPYLMQRTADGGFMPWTPDQDDVLATDWCISTWTAPARVSGIRVSEAPEIVHPENASYRTAMSWATRGYEVSRNDWGGSCVFVAVGEDGQRVLVSEDKRLWYPTQEDKDATDWYVRVPNGDC